MAGIDCIWYRRGPLSRTFSFPEPGFTADPSDSGKNLFQLLPSGWRYRAPYAKNNKFKNIFFPESITQLTLTHHVWDNSCPKI